MTRPKINTEYDPKPIPDRAFDWSAVRDGYEPGEPIGYGKTEFEAICDLERQESEIDESNWADQEAKAGERKYERARDE